MGVGSAGTVTGVGETIKGWTNNVRIVAVEPYENQARAAALPDATALRRSALGWSRAITTPMWWTMWPP